MRFRALLAALLLLVVVVPAVPGSALAGPAAGGTADTRTADTGRSLAVSVPPGATPIAPGGAATIPVRVTNPGNSRVVVTVSPRGVELGDDGAVEMAAAEDPAWRDLVDVPEGRLAIAARGYIDAPITVRMPAGAPPDLYFLGFVVTPEPATRGDVQVVNQIGSFVTVEVPGPRDRRLHAELLLPGLAFGHRGSGTVHVENVGQASVQFWGATGPERADRLDRMLLPAGRARDLEVHTSSPRYLVGFVTTTVRLTHPGTTDAEAVELVLTDRTFVVHPIVLLALAPVALVIAWWRLSPRERAQRDRARRTRHGVTRHSAETGASREVATTAR
jgi:hypothetical protein